jgi:hypothetical protein
MVRAIHSGNDMLRITIHEDGKVCRLELAGRLEGPSVAETENAWRFALGPDRKIEVDLRQLTGVDNAGRDLLAAFYLAGACLIVEGVWLTALIGDLTSQPGEGAMVQSSRTNLPRRPTLSATLPLRLGRVARPRRSSSDRQPCNRIDANPRTVDQREFGSLFVGGQREIGTPKHDRLRPEQTVAHGIENRTLLLSHKARRGHRTKTALRELFTWKI